MENVKSAIQNIGGIDMNQELSNKIQEKLGSMIDLFTFKNMKEVVLYLRNYLFVNKICFTFVDILVAVVLYILWRKNEKKKKFFSDMTLKGEYEEKDFRQGFYYGYIPQEARDGLTSCRKINLILVILLIIFVISTLLGLMNVIKIYFFPEIEIINWIKDSTF